MGHRNRTYGCHDNAETLQHTSGAVATSLCTILMFWMPPWALIITPRKPPLVDNVFIDFTFSSMTTRKRRGWKCKPL